MSDIKRICLSDSPTCSGVNPCGPCAQKLFQHVMPGALADAHLFRQGQEAEVTRFFDAYAQRWVAMLNELGLEVERAPHQPPLQNGSDVSEQPATNILRSEDLIDVPQGEVPMTMGEQQMLEAHGVLPKTNESTPPPAIVRPAAVEPDLSVNDLMELAEMPQTLTAEEAQAVEQAKVETPSEIMASDEGAKKSARDIAQRARELRQRIQGNAEAKEEPNHG